MFMCLCILHKFLGFVDFVIFMIFAFLEKHKIKTSEKGKHVFVVFGFFYFLIFFLCFWFSRMQELICACRW